MSLFTDAEIAYLQTHQLGRLATTGTSGMPHVVPAGYHYDPTSSTIKIGQHALEGRGQRRLYIRHLERNPKAAFVVDDVVTEPIWAPNGIAVKGKVRLHQHGGEELGPGFGATWIEVLPSWVSSWGIDNDSFDPAVPRTLPDPD